MKYSGINFTKHFKDLHNENKTFLRKALKNV